MTDEDAFLARLASVPADDTARLVYADWLEEQNTNDANRKAEFLRLTCGWALSTAKRQKEIAGKLQTLAATLEPSWSAVVSNPAIENCAGKKSPRGTGGRMGMQLFRFDFVCDKKWKDLAPTETNTVRHCETCQQNVHFCETITEAREHAWEGHCISIDLGVIRRKSDLDMPMSVAGMPSEEYLRSQEELRRPDPVSLARELRKAERKSSE